MCACGGPTSTQRNRRIAIAPRIEGVVNTALSWHVGRGARALAGLSLLRDGKPFAHRNLAVAHSIERSNQRLAPFDALHLADLALDAASLNGLDGEFFCATLLQESAFDPDAVSSAGAVGIAQFTIATADSYAVNPFDAQDAIRGSAALLAEYVKRYRGTYADPYAAALGAYNAGPDAVAKYRGVPPYPETQAYIGDVYERWARILSEERATRRPA